MVSSACLRICLLRGVFEEEKSSFECPNDGGSSSRNMRRKTDGDGDDDDLNLLFFSENEITQAVYRAPAPGAAIEKTTRELALEQVLGE